MFINDIAASEALKEIKDKAELLPSIPIPTEEEMQASVKKFEEDYPEIKTVGIDDIRNAIVEISCSNSTLNPKRPYDGPDYMDSGKRGQTVVTGLTMRDIRDCYIKAIIRSHSTVDVTGAIIEPNSSIFQALLSEEEGGYAEADSANFVKYDDIYRMVGEVDLSAVGQNLLCEIERAMKIFPNIAVKA